LKENRWLILSHSKQDVEVLDGKDGEYTPPVEAGTPKLPSACASSSAPGSGAPAKGSRMSTRDVQLGRAVANNRMEVVVKAAELQEQATLKATQLSVASRLDCMKRCLGVQQAMHAKTIAATREATAVHRQAVDNDRKMAREHNQSQQVIEFTKMFRESGETPMEAIRLAREAVYGPEGGR
jgi:hypothetical protein